MSDNNKKFRSSMGGFNKQDVNSYIIEVNKRFNEAKEEFESQKNALKAKTTELETANASLKEEIHAANDAILKAKEDTDSAEEKLKFAEAEIISLRKQLESVISELPHEEDEDRDTESRKAELYDKLSSQVGDIMINASKNAEEIIRRAEETAKKIINDGESKVAASKEHMREAMNTVIADINVDISTSTDACIDEFRCYVEDITSSSKALVVELEKKYTEMKEKIARYQSSLEENVTGHINSLT